MTNEEYLKLKSIIEDSRDIVFFGGAGVSTESGIPDFRSKDGLYNKRDINFAQYEPEYLLSHKCLRNEPEVFYEFYRQKLDARAIEPNITHKILAKMEACGKLKAIVTQNIDGLHQKAGSKVVYEIHGTTQKNYCDRCGKLYNSDYLFETNEKIPTCNCGGRIRPDVTLYGEDLPVDAVNGAIRAIREADCLIIGGTSLKVYPACTYISYFAGRHLIVINKERLDIALDDDADLMICNSLGNVFSKIDHII